MGVLNSFFARGGEFAHQKELPRGFAGGGGGDGQAWN